MRFLFTGPLCDFLVYDEEIGKTRVTIRKSRGMCPVLLECRILQFREDSPETILDS